jgi:predicted transcriptional regulator|tara:strand:- start:169 stop:519 length:351 start_codon:yes stop_codon:yes gene_type:complete
MQELIQTREITEDARKQTIIECIADKYAKQILKNTVEKPKSALKISKEESIPLSTVYRKLQKLHDGKLLAVSGSINRDGKRYFLYMSKIKGVTIRCDLGEPIVECILNDNLQQYIN